MRAFQCWLLTVCGFLVLDLGSEHLQNWLQNSSVRLGHAQRALLLMLVSGIAFTLASDLLQPYLQKTIKKTHGMIRPSRGAAGSLIGALALLVAIYFGYYFTFR